TDVAIATFAHCPGLLSAVRWPHTGLHERTTLTDITFGALGVPAALVTALEKVGKTTAFPIQVDTLPDTLNGRDVLGRGKTGSGKTLAFSIPMVARLGGKLAGGKRR